MLRQPAVAGQFYPNNPTVLRQTIEDFLPYPPSVPAPAIAVIVPHAGYIYSGAVAAETFARVSIPSTVFIMGPNHRGMGSRAAVMDRGGWKMPFGTVPIEQNAAAMLLSELALLQADATAHTFEHSLEVQVPFLQYFAKSTCAIVPICLSQLAFSDCQGIGMALAAVSRRLESLPLLVASTDMTHYESRTFATKQDTKAMECITNLDPQALYNTVLSNQISMCGFIPTTIALIAAVELGATSAKLIRYSDSGETSGDINQVVGYAGFILS